MPKILEVSAFFLKEACVQSVHEALIAEKLGADRLEFCADLAVDGLTPSFKEIGQLQMEITIPYMVMIRPRPGDFEYTRSEINEMREAIEAFKSYGIRGFVFGVTKGNELDFEVIYELAEIAAPFEVCIHKAIDTVVNPIKAVEQLNTIPFITRILTSGGAKTAEEGTPVLKEMMAAATNLSIMPAGRIKGSNIAALHEHLNAKEYHGRSIMMNF